MTTLLIYTKSGLIISHGARLFTTVNGPNRDASLNKKSTGSSFTTSDYSLKTAHRGVVEIHALYLGIQGLYASRKGGVRWLRD